MSNHQEKQSLARWLGKIDYRNIYVEFRKEINGLLYGVGIDGGGLSLESNYMVVIYGVPPRFSTSGILWCTLIIRGIEG